MLVKITGGVRDSNPRRLTRQMPGGDAPTHRAVLTSRRLDIAQDVMRMMTVNIVVRSSASSTARSTSPIVLSTQSVEKDESLTLCRSAKFVVISCQVSTKTMRE